MSALREMNWRVFLGRNWKPRPMWWSGLWCDGLCCSEECQDVPSLKGPSVSVSSRILSSWSFTFSTVKMFSTLSLFSPTLLSFRVSPEVGTFMYCFCLSRGAVYLDGTFILLLKWDSLRGCSRFTRRPWKACVCWCAHLCDQKSSQVVLSFTYLCCLCRWVCGSVSNWARNCE